MRKYHPYKHIKLFLKSNTKIPTFIAMLHNKHCQRDPYICNNVVNPKDFEISKKSSTYSRMPTDLKARLSQK